MNKIEQLLKKIHFNWYDFRGPWASKESKDEILKQLNKKIDERVTDAISEVLTDVVPKKLSSMNSNITAIKHQSIGWDKCREEILEKIKEWKK